MFSRIILFSELSLFCAESLIFLRKYENGKFRFDFTLGYLRKFYLTLAIYLKNKLNKNTILPIQYYSSSKQMFRNKIFFDTPLF